MSCGGISLVLRKAETGILQVKFGHARIAPGLGDNGRRADRRHQIVATHQGFDLAIFKQISEVRRFVAVNDDVRGPDRQRLQRAAHSQERGLQDVEGVDFPRRGDANANGNGALAYQQAQLRPALRTQFF